MRSHEDCFFELFEVNSAALVFVTGFEDLINGLAMDRINSVVAEEIFVLVAIDLSIAVLVKQLEHFLQVSDLEQLVFIKRRGQELSVVDLSVFVDIDGVYQLFEFLRIERAAFFSKGPLQLANSDVTVVVCINLSEEFSQLLHVFLRHLRDHIGRSQFLQLHKVKSTRENLVYSCIFRKLTLRPVFGTYPDIHGWAKIPCNVILFPAGTSIREIRSLAYSLTSSKSGAE
jgi:hypothetical protein